jgi:hypothetical protein
MLMNLKALSREIHEEQGQEKKFHPPPLPTDMPIRIDMTIGDPSARIVKVKHQGVEETVRVLNNVLRKMNSDMKLELFKNGSRVEVSETVSQNDLNRNFEMKNIVEESSAGIEHS